MKIDILQNRTLNLQIFCIHKVDLHTSFEFDYLYTGTALAESFRMHQLSKYIKCGMNRSMYYCTVLVTGAISSLNLRMLRYNVPLSIAGYEN